jgi:cysteine desulfurase/selenocysteine lyase
MEKINAYEHELSEYLYNRLSKVKGVSILGPQDAKNRAALCAFSHDSIHPSDLSTFLDMEGVAIRAGHHCCQPLHHELGFSHSARASFYFYNTKEYIAFLMPRRCCCKIDRLSRAFYINSDIDAFIEHLEGTATFFTNLESGSSENGEEDFVPFI